MNNSGIIDGFILINKDIGKTSFETVNALRKILSIKKAGHAGTLDKNASGLLVAALGKSTKLLKYFFKQDKSYEAEIYFGLAKNTDDANGIDIKKYDGKIDFQVIEKELKKFSGIIEQSPPLFSAVHINGERSYKLALKNKDIKSPKRKINIKQLNIISYNEPILKIFVECSSGTYIRSIARDLGEQTGYFAYLFSLKRVTIGKFCVNDSFTLENIKKNCYTILSADTVLPDYQKLLIKKEFIKDLKNGMQIKKEWFEIMTKDINGIFKVISDNELLAMIKITDGIYSYDLVY